MLVPLVSLPLLKLLGRTTSDLEGPARTLADKAHDPFGVVLLFVIVVIGAPIAEELFFRGLVMRSVERRLGRACGRRDLARSPSGSPTSKASRRRR